ncbi:MAG: hypothetical protein ACPLSK_02245 [bacterium]
MKRLVLVFTILTFAISSFSLDAFTLLRQYLEKERKVSYEARQSYLIYTHRGYIKSEAILKKAQGGRTRLEFVSPPFYGYVMVWGKEGGIVIPPRKGRAPSHLAIPTGDLIDIHLDLLSKSAKVSLEGVEYILGRQARVFLIKPAYVKGGYLKVWVDSETGIRLRTERYFPTGKLLSSISLLNLQIGPRFKKEEFIIPPQKVKPRDYSIEELKEILHFRPLFPSRLPRGYKIVYKSPIFAKGRGGVIIHLTDGLNPITILEIAKKHKLPPMPSPFSQEVVYMTVGKYGVYLTGNVEKEVLEEIGRSLKWEEQEK